MKSKIRKTLFGLMAGVLCFAQVSSCAYAADEGEHFHEGMETELVYANMSESFSVSYSKEDDCVIEKTSFIDVDGEKVIITRIIFEDGSGKIDTLKGNTYDSVVLQNQDYEVFKTMVKLSSNSRVLRGPTMGKDVTGKQFKHVYISSNTFTYNAPSNLESVTITSLMNLGMYALGVTSTIAYTIANVIYSAIVDNSADKVVTNQSVYEVLFSYDNNYYTHCYHEIIRSYNKAGKLIDTTKAYKQANGGM